MFRSQLLKLRHIVEGSNNRLESIFFKALSLVGRPKEDGNLVFGSFVSFDETSEDGAPDVT